LKGGTWEMRARLQAMTRPSSKYPKPLKKYLGNQVQHRLTKSAKKMTKIYKTRNSVDLRGDKSGEFHTIFLRTKKS
jgi:hypothetical protein